MFLNFLRYFGLDSTECFERMTIREYLIRMKAYNLKKLDKLELIHQQAWANNAIKATKTQGKKEVPYYQKFDKFFDKQDFENRILGIKKSSGNDAKLIHLMKKANK